MSFLPFEVITYQSANAHFPVKGRTPGQWLWHLAAVRSCGILPQCSDSPVANRANRWTWPPTPNRPPAHRSSSAPSINPAVSRSGTSYRLQTFATD